MRCEPLAARIGWAAVQRRATGLLGLVLTGLLLAGCGYEQGGVFTSSVRTVAVPIFDNQSFYRGLEFELTEATIKQIELRTPYKVVSQDVADTVLHGTIRRVEQTLLSRGDDGGLPQELELRVLLDMEWLDARTGQPLRSCEGFEVVGHYIPSRPIGQPLDEAVHSVAQRAADRAVMMMRDAW